MAYLLTNEHNSIFLLSKNMEQLQLQLPSYVLYESGKAGKMVTVSNEDFIRILSNESFNYDGTSLNFTGMLLRYENETSMQQHISNLIEKIESIYNKYENTSFGAELTAFKNLLNTVDPSSFTYPYNNSLEKYLQDQGHSVISSLQMV